MVHTVVTLSCIGTAFLLLAWVFFHLDRPYNFKGVRPDTVDTVGVVALLLFFIGVLGAVYTLLIKANCT